MPDLYLQLLTLSAFKTSVPHCLRDLSVWLANKHLHLSMPQTKPLVVPQPCFTGCISYSNGDNSVLPVGWTKNIGVLFGFSFSLILFPSSNLVANPVGSSFSVSSEFSPFPSPHCPFQSEPPSSRACTGAVTSSWVSLHYLSFAPVHPTPE